MWVPLAVRLSHYEHAQDSCEGMIFERAASWGSSAVNVVDVLIRSLCGAWSHVQLTQYGQVSWGESIELFLSSTLTSQDPKSYCAAGYGGARL